MFYVMFSLKLSSTYLLDELFNNLDNVFVKLMKEKRNKYI